MILSIPASSLGQSSFGFAKRHVCLIAFYELQELHDKETTGTLSAILFPVSFVPVPCGMAPFSEETAAKA
ncbi:MAG: hypothetical protein U1E81_10415 [Xanthobacteraceae bacterium]